jgi:aquaporin NIP
VQGADLRSAFAEATGVFFLVLAGCAAVLAGTTVVAVALAFAFAVTVLVYALGHACGAHYNPAITVALAVTGHFPWRSVPLYVGAQVTGAVAAALALLTIYDDVGPAATGLAPGIEAWQAFIVETLATGMLALVIIGVATDRRAAATLGGLAIGLAVAVGVLWAGPLTGASMNPARSLGPALVAGEWTDLWVYVTAPFAGAIAAMLVYEALRGGALPRGKGERLGALGPLEDRR